MSPLPDRQKQRREYLRKKRVGRALSSTGATIFASAVVVSGALIVVAILTLIVDHDVATAALYLMAAIALMGAVSKFSADVMKKGNDLSDVSYVPPITPDHLPAEEVLVRGATEPSAPAETLLRAAESNEETGPDQLLRVAPGATGEKDQ